MYTIAPRQPFTFLECCCVLVLSTVILSMGVASAIGLLFFAASLP